MRVLTLLAFLILIVVLATGVYATTPSGVVVSGQVYYSWSDWGPFWGALFSSPYTQNIASDPGDWLYAMLVSPGNYGQGAVQFGTNTTHSGPRTVGAYDSYVCSSTSAGVAEFDFDFFAVVNQSQYPLPVDHWGSRLLRLELWQVQHGTENWRFDNLLWSSNGPWNIEPQHAHVTLTNPNGIWAYAFRLTTVPEPASFTGLALSLVGFFGWWFRAERRAVES